MISGFESISAQDQQKTIDAIALITVLIAGADGDIDLKEKEWAEKITKIRAYHNPNELTPFYEAVGKEYVDKLEELIKKMPSNIQDRRGIISRKLTELNDVLPKLENNIGHHLLESYRSFAKHVAKASGGFLGFFSVSKAESELISLPMLNDVPFVEPEDGFEEE